MVFNGFEKGSKCLLTDLTGTFIGMRKPCDSLLQGLGLRCSPGYGFFYP